MLADAATAIVVAAGRGERFGAGLPKVLAQLSGKPLVAWSLSAVIAAGLPRAVVTVPPGGGAAIEDALSRYASQIGLRFVEGGTSRSASVRAALAAIELSIAGVAVHDAARPLVDPRLFSKTLAALADADAAIAAAPVTDTIKQADAQGVVQSTLDRSALWAVQTPQAFRTTVLRTALDVDDESLSAATDDAQLVERAGGSVRIVPASSENVKITTPTDLALAQELLRGRTR